MKDKLLIVFTILIVIAIYIIAVRTSPDSTDSVLLQKIEKLENKIDSLSIKKDSIRTVIITVDKEIIKNEKHYEEVVNRIITNSASADSIFSRDYISKFIVERTR